MYRYRRRRHRLNLHLFDFGKLAHYERCNHDGLRGVIFLDRGIERE
tara:strand:- start:444 stop:581 length:138 start_codon:yes stop_codon:yes gene_type:complete